MIIFTQTVFYNFKISVITKSKKITFLYIFSILRFIVLIDFSATAIHPHPLLKDLSKVSHTIY